MLLNSLVYYKKLGFLHELLADVEGFLVPAKGQIKFIKSRPRYNIVESSSFTRRLLALSKLITGKAKARRGGYIGLTIV